MPNIQADHEMLALNYKAFFYHIIKTEQLMKTMSVHVLYKR